MFVATFMFISMLAAIPQGGPFSERECAILKEIPDGGHIMKVYNSDDPGDITILRQVCDPVEEDILLSEEFALLVRGMLATVKDPENTGVGIAAPQVGITKRIIAVQRFDREGEPFEFYLNPRIVSASDEMVQSPEGCLSVNDERGVVMRHRSIVVEYNHSVDFRLCREEIEGFTAIIFQHETDHLEGVLFTDKTIATNGEI